MKRIISILVAICATAFAQPTTPINNARITGTSIASSSSAGTLLGPVLSISALEALPVTSLTTGVSISVLGYYAVNDGGGGSYTYTTSSSATVNHGTVCSTPSGGTTRWLLNYIGPVSLRQFGAKGNGSFDDTTFVRAALIACNEVYAPAGTYLCTAVIDFKSNNTLTGDGTSTIFSFVPTSAPSDRMFRIDSTVSGLRAVSGAIAIGATTFTAASAGSTSDLVAGDWLQVYETDHVSGSPDDICNIDWVQVKSISSATITVVAPFRTAFTGTHVTYGFARVSPLIQNVRLYNFSILVSDVVNSPIGLNVGNCRHVSIDNVKVQGPTTSAPPAIFTYRASDCAIDRCQFINCRPDFASTVDFKLTNSFVGTESTVSPSSSGVTVETGMGWFTITNNTLLNSANIGWNFQLAGHDGQFANNTVSYVTSPSSNLGTGLTLAGFQRVNIIGNVLIGGQNNGATTGNIGVSTSDITNFVGANIPSSGNVVAGNSVVNFLNLYSIDSSDTLADFSGGFINGPFYGTTKGVITNASAAAGYVGELIISTVASGSSVSLGTGVASDVTSVSLTAGCWDIDGVIYFQPSASTVISWIGGAASTTSAAGVGNDGTGSLGIVGSNPATIDFGFIIPKLRVQINSTSPVYLTAESAFSVSTMKAYGRIRATRIR